MKCISAMRAKNQVDFQQICSWNFLSKDTASSVLHSVGIQTERGCVVSSSKVGGSRCQWFEYDLQKKGITRITLSREGLR